MAIEVDRSRNAPTRRKVSGLGRLDPVEDFYYELHDGQIRALGEVSQVEAAEVRRRTLDSLTLTARDLDVIREDMDEPPAWAASGPRGAEGARRRRRGRPGWHRQARGCLQKEVRVIGLVDFVTAKEVGDGDRRIGSRVRFPVASLRSA